MNFTETVTYPVISSHKTTGTYFYDSSNGRQRIDRANGEYDRYCGSVEKFKNTPCSHLVVSNKRYLVFPKKEYCCFCCSSKDGCGILSPNWLKNATFEGKVQYDGYDNVSKWVVKGLQSNIYYGYDKSTTNEIPLAINQKPDDLMVFDVTSYSDSKISDFIFKIPKYCYESSGSPRKCPLLSVCSVA
jgi:hypothetical protein